MYPILIMAESPGYHEVYKMLDEVCDKIIEKYATGNGSQANLANQQEAKRNQ
ncbi:MAG: hypothetical protein WDO71_02275 [Bacteroidota bacterium]